MHCQYMPVGGTARASTEGAQKSKSSLLVSTRASHNVPCLFPNSLSPATYRGKGTRRGKPHRPPWSLPHTSCCRSCHRRRSKGRIWRGRWHPVLQPWSLHRPASGVRKHAVDAWMLVRSQHASKNMPKAGARLSLCSISNTLWPL
jgi:hypothetical protein